MTFFCLILEEGRTNRVEVKDREGCIYPKKREGGGGVYFHVRKWCPT